MEMIDDPRSTIEREITGFDSDRETALAESTIRELIAIYPNNQRLEHVLAKAITINALYHARVLDIDFEPLATHIHRIDGLDESLKQGLPEAVDTIWNSNGTRRRYFSFATKFCSWHNQEAYAIYDLNVWEALVAYRATGRRFTFRTSECDDYAGFLAVVKRFRETYGLEDYSIKSIDKFLWRVGGLLLTERRAPHHDAV